MTGPTAPAMIYGCYTSPFTFLPRLFFATNSSWHLNETLVRKLWLTVPKTIVQDTWATIDLVFRSIKRPLLRQDPDFPAFPKDPGKRLYFYLKESQESACTVKRKGPHTANWLWKTMLCNFPLIKIAEAPQKIWKQYFSLSCRITLQRCLRVVLLSALRTPTSLGQSAIKMMMAKWSETFLVPLAINICLCHTNQSKAFSMAIGVNQQ